jgi:predicted GTPase
VDRTNLKVVEKEVDIILWDGGNNDLPFFRPDLHIVVVDPLRQKGCFHIRER